MSYSRTIQIQLTEKIDENDDSVQAVCAELERRDQNLDITLVAHGTSMSTKPDKLYALVFGGGLVEAESNDAGGINAAGFCERILEAVTEARERKVYPIWAGSNSHLPSVPTLAPRA